MSLRIAPSRSQVDRQSVDRVDGNAGNDCSPLSVFSIEDSAVDRQGEHAGGEGRRHTFAGSRRNCFNLDDSFVPPGSGFKWRAFSLTT
jgi:hypothetical protein